MIESVQTSARISECGLFRYWLLRRWDGRSSPLLPFVMLNPSTADAHNDDPTIRRCIGFAKREGFDGIVVYNLYGFRATDPKELLTTGDPIGDRNDIYLTGGLAQAIDDEVPVVAAWGSTAPPDRVRTVMDLVPGTDWRCLGVTKAGHPRHPLYVKGDQPLTPFRVVESAS